MSEGSQPATANNRYDGQENHQVVYFFKTFDKLQNVNFAKGQIEKEKADNNSAQHFKPTKITAFAIIG